MGLTYFYIVISNLKNTLVILFGDTIRVATYLATSNYNKIPSSPLQYATIVLYHKKLIHFYAYTSKTEGHLENYLLEICKTNKFI